MEFVLEIVKGWGPPGALALLMWVMLKKSEERESKKDMRIQMLENQLIESYDERIAAADQLAAALHGNSAAMGNLIGEIRSGGRGKGH